MTVKFRDPLSARACVLVCTVYFIFALEISLCIIKENEW